MRERFEFRSANDVERDEFEGDMCIVHTGSDSLVQQSFKDDADINVIVRRFGIAERLPVVPVDPRFYGDVSDVPDLRTALDIVRDARNRFDGLPVELRNRFRNDPAYLWSFVNDPRNADEAVKLGLLRREEPPAVPATPVGDVAPTSGAA